MTRAQMEAARARVDDVLSGFAPSLDDLDEARWDELCSRLVTAVLGHPDGKVPRAKPGREAQRVAHLPRRAAR